VHLKTAKKERKEHDKQHLRMINYDLNCSNSIVPNQLIDTTNARVRNKQHLRMINNDLNCFAHSIVPNQ